MIVVGTLVVAFALFITAHVAITFGLAFRPPRWRALAAFLVAPLAPYWAWREHMRVRAGIWAAALILYVVATIVSRF
ncbi:MAG: hypothetical protein JWP87_2849 [Labilithrix sp.]|nr:hypothetical protein [Labilithrix sp.]